MKILINAENNLHYYVIDKLGEGIYRRTAQAFQEGLLEEIPVYVLPEDQEKELVQLHIPLDAGIHEAMDYIHRYYAKILELGFAGFININTEYQGLVWFANDKKPLEWIEVHPNKPYNLALEFKNVYSKTDSMALPED